MKRNKSPGADNVLNECLIFRKGSLIQLITLILNILYNTSTFPEQWSEEIVIPIYKQDAREAMRVVFLCTHKTYLYAQNEISYEYIQILF